MTTDKRCTKIKHPNLQDGWGCCVCRVYNGDQRVKCKECGHGRCDVNANNKVS